MTDDAIGPTNALALTHRVALVTGASSGIGAATALGLAAHGAKVALTARRADRLEQLARRIQDAGGTALAVPADMAIDAEVQAVLAQTEQHFGRLDILVNSAGVMLLSPIADAVVADWRRMLELDLLALMVACKGALPIMQRGGGGHIVNVASLAGRFANPNASAYSAAKFGVVGFSESLRREVYVDKIRVTVVEPGVVATELGDHITHPAMKAGLVQRLQAIEPLQAEDVAAAIAYAVTQPAHVNVNEIVIRPTGQER